MIWSMIQTLNSLIAMGGFIVYAGFDVMDILGGCVSCCVLMGV